jgi:hypothetical protein
LLWFFITAIALRWRRQAKQSNSVYSNSKYLAAKLMCFDNVLPASTEQLHLSHGVHGINFRGPRRRIPNDVTIFLQAALDVSARVAFDTVNGHRFRTASIDSDYLDQTVLVHSALQRSFCRFHASLGSKTEVHRRTRLACNAVQVIPLAK